MSGAWPGGVRAPGFHIIFPACHAGGGARQLEHRQSANPTQGGRWRGHPQSHTLDFCLDTDSYGSSRLARRWFCARSRHHSGPAALLASPAHLLAVVVLPASEMEDAKFRGCVLSLHRTGGFVKKDDFMLPVRNGQTWRGVMWLPFFHPFLYSFSLPNNLPFFSSLSFFFFPP